MISTKYMNEFEILDKIVEIEQKLNKVIQILEKINLYLLDKDYKHYLPSRLERIKLIKQNLKDLKIL